jgi:hypothetical protein
MTVNKSSRKKPVKKELGVEQSDGINQMSANQNLKSSYVLPINEKKCFNAFC